MEACTSINDLLQTIEIYVPRYQRAYSWDTPQKNSSKQTNTDVFYDDIKTHALSGNNAQYYIGHFLFEDKGNHKYAIIDGQQRLTTIEIYLSALFAKLKTLRELTEDEKTLYENMIKRGSKYRFQTVDYDNQFFKDYIIDRQSVNTGSLETESARRISLANEYFVSCLEKEPEKNLLAFLNTIQNALCTTHAVSSEAEAIQMFLFQNSRGKRPTNLEIIKAQFMFHCHLYGGSNTSDLIEEIKNRFEKIYKSISNIENNIREDDVLTYTLRVFFNNLYIDSPLSKIEEELNQEKTENSIKFIKDFSFELSSCFDNLVAYYGEDSKKYIEIYSLKLLGKTGIILPFILKAYKYNLSKEKICELCSGFESLVVRHLIIGTRADITSRINDVYKDFTQSNSDIEPILKKIDYMKNTKTNNWWWSYWNNENFENSMNGYIHPRVAKYILWKYENFLHSKGKAGYKPIRYEDIESPQLEHIAPRHPSSATPEKDGYDKYDDIFITKYIDRLGNYLLLSGYHNDSISNGPFKSKRDTYVKLAQQLEIRDMTEKECSWNREKIDQRHSILIDFVKSNF